MLREDDDAHVSSVAIIGMAGRFPGANSTSELWSNLRKGVESISFLSDDELRDAGVADAVLADPSYVKAASILDDIEQFDAEFFKYSPREAEMLDPQHRLFLEAAVAALCDGGVDPSRFDGSIGVFAGAALSSYLLMILNSLHASAGNDRGQLPVSRTLAVQGNDKDYLATRTSYKLDLRGPSLTVQTACSTSLVAVHVACQSLLSGESDLALAGGVSVTGNLRKTGYFHVDAGILSADGHCRPFDARANGTIFGDGVGVVLLKRLGEAVADGDHIHAVIRGSAVNNDGLMKIGYTAPSVDGQASVIAEALSVAGVSPDSVGLIEAHGTGTSLGDPIEIEALHQVFRTQGGRTNACAIGSIKSNFGHLNTAAGVAGLIKAVLSVEHGEIPPSVNFDTPNSNIDFANSPFYVPTRPVPWDDAAAPRRAGISSFGIGGTNAHVVIEQARMPRAGDPSRKKVHVALVSAKTPAALDAACSALADHLRDQPQENIADVCHTLAVGRTVYPFFRIGIGNGAGTIAEALRSPDAANAMTGGTRTEASQSICLMFPGQGSQHVRMGAELYQEEGDFRAEIDRCSDLLRPHLGRDLRTLLFPAADGEAEAEELLRNTQYAQPAIFAVSFALAKLWMSLGAAPRNAIGHSIGEFVAACLAGVMSLADALRAVATRGRLMQDLPRGAMLAVIAPPAKVSTLLPASLSMAAINGPEACVVSGPTQAITAFEAKLSRANISTTRLVTSHAFHSKMMAPAVDAFVACMRSIDLKPPSMDFISNVTGDWITPAQATDPEYWGKHLLAPVQFHQGLLTVLAGGPMILLEAGPGRSLSMLARLLGSERSRTSIYSSLPRAGARGDDELRTFLSAAAALWRDGVPIAWERRYGGERRCKRPLPPYPFQHRRYWISGGNMPVPARAQPQERERGGSLLQGIGWRRVERLRRRIRGNGTKMNWLVVTSGQALDLAFVNRRRQSGCVVTIAEKIEEAEFIQLAADHYVIDPRRETDFARLFAAMEGRLKSEGQLQVVYFCEETRGQADYAREVDDKVNALIFLLRQLDLFRGHHETLLTVVTRDGQEIIGGEAASPMAALAFGPALAVRHEYPAVRARILDVPASPLHVEPLVEALDDDLADSSIESLMTGYRGTYRWMPAPEPLNAALLKDRPTPLRPNGVYLITGGLGGLGLAIARHLAENYHARLILMSRRAMPERESWDALVSDPSASDETTHIIRELRLMEKSGGEVLIAQADVAEAAELDRAVAAARARFGPIDGVIHAAGLPGNTPIGIKTAEELHAVLRPKVLGLIALEQAFAGTQLDFLALFSSISAIEGRVGQVDYIAGNAYLDAYARRASDPSRRLVVSINWDTWAEVGMAVGGRAPPSGGAVPSAAARFGLRTAEGVQAFMDALAAGYPQVVVTKRGLGAHRIETAAAPAAPDQTPTQSDGGMQDEYHPRPDLPEPYAAAETELEKQIVELWSQLLKTAPIGLNDNFFDLGGHSLLALQLLPRIREKYQIMFEPREFFAAPTVAGVVEKIEDTLLAEIEEDEPALQET
jgi:phthiocerol/phenolphthiocerol synthesis type-I polyketide synthase E